MPLSLDGNGPIGGITTQNGGQLAGLRNRIINGQFAINQRAVSGTVTLTAGSYGHDRFKAGASGCTYTFASSQNGNVITISAGTLQQVIEGANLEGGVFVLSWFGTATARIDSGSYSASGVTGTAVAGTNQTVEFGTGTVGRVQYELGTVSTTFEQRPIGMETGLCQRYYQYIGIGGTSQNYAGSGQQTRYTATPPVQCRATPTIAVASNLVVGNVSSTSYTAYTVNSAVVIGLQVVASGGAGSYTDANYIASLSCEL